MTKKISKAANKKLADKKAERESARRGSKKNEPMPVMIPLNILEYFQDCKSLPLKERAEIYNKMTDILKDMVALNHPVLAVKLVSLLKLHSNTYNPNKVAPPEMKLLELSMQKDGVIDTLAKVRKAPTGKGSLYHEDYAAGNILKRIADERGVAIVVVHHTRKADAHDIFERISGSHGLTGAADTLMVLVRDRGKSDAVLSITGRDIEELKLALKFEKGIWTVLGDAAEVHGSEAQQAIIAALEYAGRPLGPKEIAEATDRQRGSISKILKRMRESEIIIWGDRGKYSLNHKKIAANKRMSEKIAGKGRAKEVDNR